MYVIAIEVLLKACLSPELLIINTGNEINPVGDSLEERIEYYLDYLNEENIYSVFPSFIGRVNIDKKFLKKIKKLNPTLDLKEVKKVKLCYYYGNTRKILYEGDYCSELPLNSIDYIYYLLDKIPPEKLVDSRSYFLTLEDRLEKDIPFFRMSLEEEK